MLLKLFLFIRRLVAVCVFYEDADSVVRFTGKLFTGPPAPIYINYKCGVKAKFWVACSCSSVGKMTVLVKTRGSGANAVDCWMNWKVKRVYYTLSCYHRAQLLSILLTVVKLWSLSKLRVAAQKKKSNRRSMMPKFNVFCPRRKVLFPPDIVPLCHSLLCYF